MRAQSVADGSSGDRVTRGDRRLHLVRPTEVVDVSLRSRQVEALGDRRPVPKGAVLFFEQHEVAVRIDPGTTA